MTDHISRFVCNDGYALSYVRCEDTAELIGHKQHGLAYDALELASKGLIASLLMGTRLKGPGTLSLQLRAETGRIRNFRVDAMGLGFVRGLVTKLDNGEELIGTGTLSVMKQIEGSDQPFHSTVPFDSDQIIHVCNAYLRNSEQVQALICYDIAVEGNHVSRANGFYLERLPAAEQHPDCHLNNCFDELYEVKQDFVMLDDKGDDEELIARLFGQGHFNKLQEYPVRFHCPCSKERYANTLSGFNKDQLLDLVNEKGFIPTRCEFCLNEYDVPLDDVI